MGESQCLGVHPACHDEHVVYEIDSTGPRRLTLQGSRVTGRDTVAMGALTCILSAGQLEATCRIATGIWRFSLVQGHLEGSLELADSTVMRRVVAYRARPH